MKVRDGDTKFQFCSLMIDGMSIRKFVEWDQLSQSMVGFVDLGIGQVEETAPEATEVIVIMAVGILAGEKHPLVTFALMVLMVTPRLAL